MSKFKFPEIKNYFGVALADDVIKIQSLDRFLGLMPRLFFVRIELLLE